MIQHIVFWNLKEEAEGKKKEENAAIIKERLEALNGKIEGLKLARVARNFNEKGYDLCLYTEFTSKEALEHYQVHPLHLAVKGFVHQVMTERVVTDCIID